MNKEESKMASFQLIGYAGDAFSIFHQAIQEAKQGNFEESDRLILEGEEQLKKAHEAQTELLAKEAQGIDIEYSILLVHAQDHLMNAIMYERIAKEFIELYKEKNK